jgi:hypothetical protein
MVADAKDQSASCLGWFTGHMLLIRLQQRPLFGLLVNPFGTTARAIELEGNHLLVTGRSMPASVSLADVGEAPTLRKGALGTTLSLQSTGQNNVITPMHAPLPTASKQRGSASTQVLLTVKCIGSTGFMPLFPGWRDQSGILRPAVWRLFSRTRGPWMPRCSRS